MTIRWRGWRYWVLRLSGLRAARLADLLEQREIERRIIKMRST